jgi:hypothetical protein
MGQVDGTSPGAVWGPCHSHDGTPTQCVLWVTLLGAELCLSKFPGTLVCPFLEMGSLKTESFKVKIKLLDGPI